MAECLEHKTKSKIGKTFANEKILEKYSVKVYEIDSYFYEHYKKKNTKKKQANRNGRGYLLLRIDVKKQEALEKKIFCKFIRINTSNCDKDYEIGRIQTFISKFKNRQSKELEKESNKKVKKLEDEIKKKLA